MPRGVYDRSKGKKQKSPTKKVTKSHKGALMASGMDQNITENKSYVLSLLHTGATILSTLRGDSSYEATILKAKVLSVVKDLAAPKEETAVTEKAEEPKVGTVSYPPPTAGVKFKKDGTPKMRPGPKPKAVKDPEPVAESSSPQPNGNSDVFNPEHAS